MNSRRFRNLILVALLLIAASAVATQLRMDIPAAVPPNRWVPLTEKAGIAILGEPDPRASKPQGRGQLWVKAEGGWVQLAIEPPPELVPAR